MTELTNRIIWLDIETTGSNPENSDVLEVGIITTDDNLREIARNSWVAHWDKSFDSMDEEVVKMHMNNGLWYDAWQSDMTVPGMESRILNWLDIDALDGEKATGNKIPVGGSGVGHFDLRFLKHHMPYLSKSFTYWCYDVGVIRRTLRLAGREHIIPGHNSDKNHRALDDIELHLKEMQFYCSVLQAHIPAHWEN